ncbi:hypothetical protein AB0L10_41830 [Streptomyces flaveolus]|uniref:hypothetical protein n=1 Tax=Streptomyces flaveolus TaxID=67297 RepID=UPI003420538F
MTRINSGDDVQRLRSYADTCVQDRGSTPNRAFADPDDLIISLRRGLRQLQ